MTKHFWSLGYLSPLLFETNLLVSGYRAVGRFENPGVPVLFGGHNLSFLVEIGLTDLSKSGGAERPVIYSGIYSKLTLTLFVFQYIKQKGTAELSSFNITFYKALS